MKRVIFIFFGQKTKRLFFIVSSTIFVGKNASYRSTTKGKEWKGNDAISMMVDCNNWKIRYYLNNNQIGKDVEIDNTKTYHAIFTTWPGYETTYKLIETEIALNEAK